MPASTNPAVNTVTGYATGASRNLSGFHWQPMGSDAPPAWLEGSTPVFSWFMEHTGEGAFDQLLKGIQETLFVFHTNSPSRAALSLVDFSLKLNESVSTIKFFVRNRRTADPEVKGHEGRIILRDEATGDTIVERLFFIVLTDTVDVTHGVYLAAQLL